MLVDSIKPDALLADIIAYMRFEAEKVPETTNKMVPWSQVCDLLNKYAGKLQSAWARECLELKREADVAKNERNRIGERMLREVFPAKCKNCIEAKKVKQRAENTAAARKAVATWRESLPAYAEKSVDEVYPNEFSSHDVIDIDDVKEMLDCIESALGDPSPEEKVVWEHVKQICENALKGVNNDDTGKN